MKASKHILLTIVCLLMSYVSFGQTAEPSDLSYVEKRYNIFFPINTSNVDSTFHKNSHTIQTLRQDIRNTFCVDSTLQFETDSILIIATSSLDVEVPHSDIDCYLPASIFPERQKVAAVRTNLLSPLSNVGAEMCINDRWSVEADYYFPWLCRKADHKNAMQMLAWGVTGRYWLGKNRTYTSRLLGHSVGLGAYAGYYDFERNYTGHQGEFASVCLDYMYAMPVFNNRMHLEFTVGLGYLYSYARPYDVFESGGKAFREGYAKNIHWAGPLKAGVSLVVPIYMTRK